MSSLGALLGLWFGLMASAGLIVIIVSPHDKPPP